MATITINLLDTKRTVLSKNNKVFLSAPNSDYLIVAGEDNATDFAVLYNEIYNEYVFTITMVNAKGEGTQFELVNNAFELESNMTVAGYTKIYITATNGESTIAWERIDIKIASTSPDYIALTENSIEFVRYNQQTLTEAQQTQVRNNINAASKDDIRVEKYAFETYANFTDWLGGTFTRDDGIVPNDLVVGDEILLVETDKPDYWLKSKSTPITIADFAITETDLSNYLAKDNTTEYTPTSNYHPATKLYADGKVNPLIIYSEYVGLGVYTWDTAENREKFSLYMQNPSNYNLLFYNGIVNFKNTYYSLNKYLINTHPPLGEITYYSLYFGFKTETNNYVILYNTEEDTISIESTTDNDFTNEEQTKLSGIEAGAEVNIIETIKVNNVALTPTEKTVSFTVPTQASDIGALPDTTKYGATIDLTYTALTGELQLDLKDQDGTTLSTETVDLPMELIITSGSVGTCTVDNEPVVGYVVGDKYIDLVLANGEHLYILASDFIDQITITETGTGNAVTDISINGSVLTEKKDKTFVETSEIVNDLTTGGTTVPLSAEQGKNLNTYKIGGNTIYGGTISDNFDTITKTGFYTCYGIATGAPNSTYSWFILHENSNAGTVSAKQTATAYSTETIIYVRTKISSTWGAWVKITTEKDTQTYTTTLPTTSGDASDWQAVMGGYELAKTISGLTIYDSIVSVASDDTIWTENELNATITTDTLTFFVSSLPSAEVELILTVTKSTNGGTL